MTNSRSGWGRSGGRQQKWTNVGVQVTPEQRMVDGRRGKGAVN
jgi:hypothetical protein